MKIEQLQMAIDKARNGLNPYSNGMKIEPSATDGYTAVQQAVSSLNPYSNGMKIEHLTGSREDVVTKS